MKHLLIGLLICICSIIKAQDQLFKKDNTKLEVKIIEVNPAEIKYKLYTYLDGPMITVLKSDVALIIYQNGVHEVINTPPPSQPQTVVVYSDDYRNNRSSKSATDSARLRRFDELVSTKNLVSFNVMDLLNGSAGFSYIRELKGNFVHLYVPVSLGFTTPYFNQPSNTVFGSGYYSQNNISSFKFDRKTVEAGLGIHFQTSGKHAVTHFIGPYFGISQFTGTFREYDNYNYYYNNDPLYNSIEHGFVMNRVHLMLDNGLLFRFNKHFNAMMLAGIGYHIDTFVANDPAKFASGRYYNYNNFNSFPINSFKFGLSFGYRF